MKTQEDPIWDMYDKWFEQRFKHFEKDVNQKYKQWAAKTALQLMELELRANPDSPVNLTVTIKA